MAKRAYRNAAQWQQLIDLWHTSELSITEFCQTHQLSTMSFYKWRQRLSPQTEQANVHQDTPFIDLSVSVHFRTSYSHLRSRDKLCTHHYRRVIWQSELTATLHNGSN
ncbi:IS66 family insertion sequence element accessory protein TnpA [Shewanella xiamenensis]|uniref:IS66 family insertion sequence element accessory protein TnpA n=1 Tax=Shewanella xiamenensis TaxID=332186 RepID=UPI00374F5629